MNVSEPESCTAKKRTASESDRALAGSLMGGAFGFIGLAMFSSASYAEKVEPNSLWWGNFAAMSSIALLAVSVMFGGWGWTRRSRPGFFNQFNLQAISGLAGMVCLVVSAVIFAFNPTSVASVEDVLSLELEINVLKGQLATERLLLQHMLSDRSCAADVE
jgi:hypothetical protein